MATVLAARGPIGLRHDISDEQEEFASFSDPDSDNESADEDASVDAESDGSHADSDKDSGQEAGGTDDDNNLSDEEPPDEKDTLKNISFGTLAEAQAQLAAPSRKRKLPTNFDDKLDRPPTNNDPDRFKPAPKVSRQSKHAPTIQSSRLQVTRKRAIFEPSPVLKSRDPRFDATVTSSTLTKSSTAKANANYSFLTTYQANELLDLRSQIKRAANDPELQASLKRQVMSIEAKLRNTEARQREDKIVQEHNRKEKVAIQAGTKAKPYYLKPSEIRKQAEEERKLGMGKKALEKSEARKKKREKSKDAKGMPRFRRE